MAMVQPKSQKLVYLLLTCYCYFYRSDYVPAADGRRYLAASGNFATGSLIGANLTGSLETGVRF